MGGLNNIIGRLNQFAVEALGVGAPQLSPQWASAAPTYNGPSAAVPFSLTFGSAWFPPFSGVYSNQVKTAHFNLDGSIVSGNLSVLRFHPQAAARLADLYANRFGSDGNASHSIRPVPESLVLRLNAAAPSDPGLMMVRAGDQTAPNNMPAATVSFHDLNGLILDPIAVAAAFRDLLTTFPLLGPNAGQFNPQIFVTNPKQAGWVDGIAALDPSVTGYVQVVNPHGGPWSDPGTGKGLTLSSGGGGATQRFTGATPLAFASGATVQAEDTAVETDPAKTQVRFGFATWGKLTNQPLTLKMTGPAAATIQRDFVRLVAVDLNRFLLGNRTASVMDSVPALDTNSLAEPNPTVREGATIRLQSDGMGVLGEAGAVLTAFSNQPATENMLAFLVSPAIDDTLSMPADTTAASRWGKAALADICPADITPTALPTGDWATTAAAAPLLASLRPGGSACTATWASATGTDVLVTIAAGIIPAGAHVRIYNRIFLITPDLAHNPTLFRGDGASRIAGSGPIQLVLKNPLNLPAQAGGAMLHFDLHVLPNNGPASRERIFGGYGLKIGAFTTAPAASATGKNLFNLVTKPFRGICTSRFMGLPAGSNISFPASPADIVHLIAQLVRGQVPIGSAGPTEALRLPTMARYESILAVNDLPAGKTTPTYTAVLSGGFFTAESHCELYHQGNPGGRATAETHASGLFADGWLARDLALAACRRALDFPNRLLNYSLSQFNDPVATPATPSTLSAAVLQTVAAGVETPELAFIPESNLAGLPNTINDLQTAVNSATTPIFTLSLPSSPNGDRVVAEIKREAYAAHYGRRDWQTSLRYALTHARELIYLETQCLVASPGSGGHDYTFDVIGDAVSGIVARLTAQPSLRLILVSPKVFPYGPNYQGWAQYFYEQRTATWAKLTAAAPGRVLAVHPIGFPGRPLNVRTSVCIIDDAWASLGTGVPRRRGLTFDGSIDVSLFDAQIANGRGVALTNFRRALMAQILNVQQPAPGATPDLDWMRLAHPRTAFSAFADLVGEGGRGLVEPALWPGPDISPNAAQASTQAVNQALGDPEGREVKTLTDAILAAPAIIPSL